MPTFTRLLRVCDFTKKEFRPIWFEHFLRCWNYIYKENNTSTDVESEAERIMQRKDDIWT